MENKTLYAVPLPVKSRRWQLTRRLICPFRTNANRDKSNYTYKSTPNRNMQTKDGLKVYRQIKLIHNPANKRYYKAPKCSIWMCSLPPPIRKPHKSLKQREWNRQKKLDVIF